LGDTNKAKELVEQALDIAREVGDENGEAKGLINIGQSYLRDGTNDEKDKHGKAQSLLSLGMLAYVQNRDNDARNFYSQAKDIAMSIGAKSLLATIKFLCSPIDGVALGKDEAVHLISEAKETFTELGMNISDERQIENLIQMFTKGQFPE